MVALLILGVILFTNYWPVAHFTDRFIPQISNGLIVL